MGLSSRLARKMIQGEVQAQYIHPRFAEKTPLPGFGELLDQAENPVCG